MELANGIEYEVHGSGEAVLLIHGAVVADSFVPLMEESALDGYRLIRYRRRGYGASDRPSTPPTIGEHVLDARALLQRLGVHRAHLVAHSGGGPVAVQLIVDEPHAILSLTLLEPALQNATMAAAFEELIAPLVEMHRAGNSSKAVHLWMRSTGGSEWRAEVEQRVPGAGDQATRDAPGTFEGDLPALRAWDFEKVDARQITQPVLYLVGEHNTTRVAPVSSMFQTAVPHTELAVVDGAGHNMQVTHPTEVANAIAEFIGRVTA